jgi:hypothetical protein
MRVREIGWGDAMPTYKDLVELARICLRRASAARDPGESATLFQLALDYSRRATQLDGTKNRDHSAVAP